MCYTIDSESILLNYFSKVDSKEITFRSLRSIRKRIEEDFNNTVYVDITLNSIRDTVSHYESIFNVELTKISLKSDKPFELENEFINNKINYKIPSNIKERYLELISLDEF